MNNIKALLGCFRGSRQLGQTLVLHGGRLIDAEISTFQEKKLFGGNYILGQKLLGRITLENKILGGRL